ncbi:alpha-amylase [uncultured Chitinophaga sp.]|uniref:alpha-amylase n=1 Tax=uncultured Chitinophaga sp. TaxID=339340 RepID=UPI0025D12E82|nr:alpha-amylase [uncultured Chitinophaga sp.]
MVNGTMMQYFHWYYPAEENLWNTIAERAPKLAEAGINALWFPPAYKGKEGTNSVGYDAYDIYDLGEFDQKGTVRTRFGTREEYEKAIEACHASGIQVYADIVLNHKAGADETERITVRRVNPDNRQEFISEPFEIDAYTKFTFPGRNGKYSEFIWDHMCFSGIDYAADLQEEGIFSIQNEYGDDWEEMIDDELGNYDYLMFDDIEFRNTAVREELNSWGKWYFETFKIDGVRLDAVKHISPKFYNEWLDYQRQHKPDLVAIGEYWAPGDLPMLLRYIDATEGRMSLFDAALHHNFHYASTQGNDHDMRTIFDNSLVQVKPELAVTVVDNHDTQPLQALEAPVEAWFKPIAYALILLRESGYPCIFYPDVYGAHYVDKGRDGNDHEIFLEQCKHIAELLNARNTYAYGPQRDYFDHANCIGWVREGDDDHEGCAVLLSNGDEGHKSMEIGKRYAGRVFTDMLKEREEEVTIDENGWGEFYTPAGGVSVWVEKKQ